MVTLKCKDFNKWIAENPNETRFDIPDGVTNLGNNVFENAKDGNIRLLYIPKSLKYIGENVFKHFNTLEKIIVNEENDIFAYEQDCLYEIASGRLFYSTSKEEIFTIPEFIKYCYKNSLNRKIKEIKLTNPQTIVTRKSFISNDGKEGYEQFKKTETAKVEKSTKIRESNVREIFESRLTNCGFKYLIGIENENVTFNFHLPQSTILLFAIPKKLLENEKTKKVVFDIADLLNQKGEFANEDEELNFLAKLGERLSCYGQPVDSLSKSNINYAKKLLRKIVENCGYECISIADDRIEKPYRPRIFENSRPNIKIEDTEYLIKVSKKGLAPKVFRLVNFEKNLLHKSMHKFMRDLIIQELKKNAKSH